MRANSSGAGATARLGAIAFIHRFGSTPNPHLHFHRDVIDGVFDTTAAGEVVFHAVTELDPNAVTSVETGVRQRMLQSLTRGGLLPADDARAMGPWEHGSGLSVDASVRVEPADCAGRERLRRYCARPPFALERLRELDPHRLIYDNPRPGPGAPATLALTPPQLLDRLVALVPPSRVHRHRYVGVPARTAGHGKFPRRPRTAEDGRTQSHATRGDRI